MILVIYSNVEEAIANVEEEIWEHFAAKIWQGCGRKNFWSSLFVEEKVKNFWKIKLTYYTKISNKTTYYTKILNL